MVELLRKSRRSLVSTVRARDSSLLRSPGTTNVGYVSASALSSAASCLTSIRLACQLAQCPVTAVYTDTNTKKVTESRHMSIAGAARASHATVAQPWIRRCVVAAAHQLWNRRRVEGDSSGGIGGVPYPKTSGL